jgi:hypothetical protein
MQTASQSEPVRQSDFVNSSSARGEWMEELSALAKLRPDSSIELFNWGYLLHLRSSSQFLEWYLKRPNTQQLLLLETIELDGFGTRLSLNKKIADLPFATYGTVCSWPDLSQATEYLRVHCVGPILWNSHHDNILPVYAQDITSALQIPAGSLNSSQLPGHCITKWGVLLRIDSAGVQRALDYFAVEQPADCERPLAINLGGNVVAVFAFSPCSKEPLRIGLCRNWADDLALKDAARWLKSFNRKEVSTP